MTVGGIRRTANDRKIAGLRLGMAVLFLMTGAMKLLVPVLATAWAGQLAAADIPLQEVSRLTVPYIEIALGLALAAGYFVRLAAAAVIGIMLVATYVHLVVEDPALFPLQPTAPVIPLGVIVLAAWLLWRGAGAWSLDLHSSPRE